MGSYRSAFARRGAGGAAGTVQSTMGRSKEGDDARESGRLASSSINCTTRLVGGSRTRRDQPHTYAAAGRRRRKRSILGLRGQRGWAGEGVGGRRGLYTGMGVAEDIIRWRRLGWHLEIRWASHTTSQWHASTRAMTTGRGPCAGDRARARSGPRQASPGSGAQRKALGDDKAK